jgi:tetratricopeptide (TPR) repeat protein
MSTTRHQANPDCGGVPNCRAATILRMVAAAALGGVIIPVAGAAGSTVPDASPDRAMEFVERSVEATELYNQRKLPEALASFQFLLHEYGDLDEDGYVAMSLADCLHMLGRHDEARVAYESVLVAHAELAEVVRSRLREVALAGEPDDALLEELRSAAAFESEDLYAIRVQLGRALQKRAAALLSEAMQAFRSAAATDPTVAQPTRRTTASQAEMLAELQEDLASLIERMERSWGAMKTLQELTESARDFSEQRIEGLHAAWMSVIEDREPVRLETIWDSQGKLQATANKRSVQLSHTQSLIIRRHQERINAILLEAMRAGPADEPQSR